MQERDPCKSRAHRARTSSSEVMPLPTRMLQGNAGAQRSSSPTIFLSAFLCSLVEPLFAKMVLPVLGGSSSVWAVALLLLPGGAARGLRLRASADPLVPPFKWTRPRAHRARAAGHRRAADRVAVRLDRAAAGRALLLAARAFRRRDRPAVRRGRRQRAAAADVVCAHRTSARARSRTFSTAPPTSAASSRCSAIRSCSSRRFGPDRAQPLLERALPGADRRARRLLCARAARRASADAADRSPSDARSDADPRRRPTCAIASPGAASPWCRRRC